MQAGDIADDYRSTMRDEGKYSQSRIRKFKASRKSYATWGSIVMYK